MPVLPNGTEYLAIPTVNSGPITVNHTQAVTLIVIAVYAVAILVLWNFPILGEVLYPFKLLVVALHEFSHASKFWLRLRCQLIFSRWMLYWRSSRVDRVRS